MATTGSQATVGSVINNFTKNPGRVMRKNAGAIGGGAFHALQFGGEVNRRVQQGTSLPGAVVAGAANAALWATSPGAMTAISVAPMAFGAVDMAFQYRRQKGQDLLAFDNPSQKLGGNYMDTQRAQTMRQAAVQQIQGNKLNARSALGGEARIFSNRHIA